MAQFLFTGGRFLDPRSDELREGVDVLTEAGRIKDIGRLTAASAQRIDQSSAGRP